MVTRENPKVNQYFKNLSNNLIISKVKVMALTDFNGQITASRFSVVLLFFCHAF